MYILASERNGTLCTGVTYDLVRRVREHKQDAIDGSTKRYGVHRLVYVEVHDDIRDAIQREKRIETWKRRWKLELIETANPSWHDLYDEVEANPRLLI